MSSGLGKSTPLVTVSGPGAIKQRGVAVPAGDNHPLAAGSLPPPPPPPPPLPATSSTASTINTTTATTPHKDRNSSPIPPPSNAVHGHPPPATMTAPAANAVIRTPANSKLLTKISPMKGGSSPQVGPPNLVASTSSSSQSKSLDDLADLFLSEPSYRTDQLHLAPLLRPTPLPREEGVDRLRTLVERRAWGDVLKISTSMLNSPKDLHSTVYASLVTLPLNAPQVDISLIPPYVRQETVEIMTLQCHAWLKLRRYADLIAEVERWNFITFNDATAQSPDWLSWSLHILAGQAQQFSEDAGSGGDRASDILFALRDEISSAGTDKEDTPQWLISVDHALANVFSREGEWRLALGSLDRMIDLIPDAAKEEVKSRFSSETSSSTTDTRELVDVLATAYKCEILSRQGRLLLQVGALSQVAKLFDTATTLWDGIKSNIPTELQSVNAVKLIPCQLDMNAGLYFFSKSNYDRAFQSFSSAKDILRAVFGGNLTSEYNVDDWMGSGIAACYDPNVIYSECLNNLALCSLYTCRMQDAVSYLEGVVREDPTAFLNERVAFNLTTLYELGSDSATSARKKRVLQLIAKRFFLHDVGPESFRVT